jgi:hypothetical protein
MLIVVDVRLVEKGDYNCPLAVMGRGGYFHF